MNRPETLTVVPGLQILSSEETERKRAKNKKRNQRKRAAEKTKKKENVARAQSPESEAKTDPEVKLETGMALVKIGSPYNSCLTEDDVLPKVKFVPRPMDKGWMSHPCLNSESCNKFFIKLQEAMLRVPTSNLEIRVYGSHT
ncbi:hypothetical protein E4T48_08582 [Aureobasidium sp. EXF-10727]|nr:hypothetical protein E4T48_08582 [Aureobasidium sp. EXF-10727]